MLFLNRMKCLQRQLFGSSFGERSGGGLWAERAWLASLRPSGSTLPRSCTCLAGNSRVHPQGVRLTLAMLPPSALAAGTERGVPGLW